MIWEFVDTATEYRLVKTVADVSFEVWDAGKVLEVIAESGDSLVPTVEVWTGATFDSKVSYIAFRELDKFKVESVDALVVSKELGRDEAKEEWCEVSVNSRMFELNDVNEKTEVEFKDKVEAGFEAMVVDDCANDKIDDEPEVLFFKVEATNVVSLRGHHVVYSVTTPCLVTVAVDKWKVVCPEVDVLFWLSEVIVLEVEPLSLELVVLWLNGIDVVTPDDGTSSWLVIFETKVELAEAEGDKGAVEKEQEGQCVNVTRL